MLFLIVLFVFAVLAAIGALCSTLMDDRSLDPHYSFRARFKGEFLYHYLPICMGFGFVIGSILQIAASYV